VAELAEHLDTDRSDVTEAMVAAHGYSGVSLSAPIGADSSTVLGDLIGSPDPDLAAVEDHETLQPLIAALPEPERKVLAWRFYGNLTQTEIAGLLGVSQMTVSRMQSRALARLRQGLLTPD
jgi:RNA polymerase sigma-B factor